MRSVHVVVPDAVDDPARPSGGNTYDRRVCAGLADLGWAVHVHPVPGRWPRPDRIACACLAQVLADLPAGSTVVLDGLVATCSPAVVVPEAARLQVVVLVHLPLGVEPDDRRDAADIGGGAGAADARERVRKGVLEAERAVLASAVAVVATSDWTRQWLLDRYGLEAGRVLVAEPGVDGAELAQGSPQGGELVCVAAVVPAKGHDQLVAALAQLRDLPWACTFAGSLDLDPAFVRDLVRQCEQSAIADRVRFVGPCGAEDLERLYAASDLLVLASRMETYGLVVTEALARGLPVISSAVGGVGQALGQAPDGTRPGWLVPSGDVEALAGALRAWLADAGLRERLRRAARGRRLALAPWSTTARRVADVLGELEVSS